MTKRAELPNEMDFGIRLKGDVAKLFETERRKNGKGKSTMARLLIIEALQSRGYGAIDDPLEWGGYREKKEDDTPGQWTAEPAR